MLRKKRLNSSYIFVLLIFIIFIGFIVDLTTGFSLIQDSSNVVKAFIIIFILGIFYILGNGLSCLINSKDHTSQPLPKRVFNLFLLLTSIVVLIFLIYKVIKFFK